MPKTPIVSISLGLCALLLSSASAAAQGSSSVFALRTAPSPAYQSPVATDYNIKWKDLYLKLAADLGLTFEDNVRYSEDDRESDLIIEPGATLGILWAPGRAHQFNMDVRFGYRAYLDNSDLDSLVIAPDSRVDYTIGINRVNIRLYDEMTTRVDAYQNVQIANQNQNNTAGGIEFRRFANEIGAEVAYQPTKDLRTRGRYGFGLDRSISGDDFQRLDRDEHHFELSAAYSVASDLSAGVFGRAALLRYKDKGLPNSLNDSDQFSTGPYLNYTAAPNLTLNGSLSYTVANYDSSGNIGDAEDFSGMTFQVGAQHKISSRISHNINLGRTIDPGVQRNFADRWTVNYGITASAARNVTLNGSLGYDRLKSSNFDSEEADLYNARAGVNFLIIRNLTGNLAYSYTLRDSNLSARSYYINRVSLIMRYDF